MDQPDSTGTPSPPTVDPGSATPTVKSSPLTSVSGPPPARPQGQVLKLQLKTDA